MGPVFLLCGEVRAEPGKEDLTKVYEAGRTAFNKGDLAKAKIAFARVLKAKPDFDLAIIYMAQIKHAEAQWEARPRSRKIAEKAVIAEVALTKVTLSDALEVLRREVEKAGGPTAAGNIALISDLSPDVLERPVELTVRNLPMMEFVDAVAFAGGVRISWHEKGLSVTATGTAPVPSDPGHEAAVKAMRQAARDQILTGMQMDGVSVREAVAWLTARTAPGKGPLIVVREPVGAARITLNLRNVPLSEAINSVALIAGLEVSWHAWGAGLSVKPQLAANQAELPPGQR